MNVKEYLEELQRLKRSAERRWGSMTSVERDVLDGSFDWLIDNLEIKKGDIIVDEDLSRIMDDFVRAVIDNVNSVPLYQSKLKSFLQDLTTIQTNNKLFHNTTNNFDIETAGVNDVQKAVVGQIIDQYTGNGLNAHFAAPLKENVFRNILAGANMREVKQVLQAYILSGQDKSGKLQRYLDQTAQQAVDSYTGAINQQLVEEFKFTGYIISGSLIETSSEQCVFAVEESVNGYLSFKDWEEVLAIARDNPKARLIAGTTIKNLPLNKLHWGCRHDFTPVIMGAVEKPPKPAEKPKPPEPVKPTEPKKPTRKAPAKPKKPAKANEPINTIQEGKDKAVKLINDNLGLNITGVTASTDLSVFRMNEYVNQIEKLVKEYRISPAIDKTVETELRFISTKGTFGKVTSSYYTRDFEDKKQGESKIKTINFGHQTDIDRSIEVSPKIAPYRTKSRTDVDTEEVATVTHEFSHVMSISQHEQATSGDPAFSEYWSDMRTIKREYHNEIRSIKTLKDAANKKLLSVRNEQSELFNTLVGTSDLKDADKKMKVFSEKITELEKQVAGFDQDFADIFLGGYASTDVDEFAAEGFTEYKLKTKPSKYAKKIGTLIDKHFKK